ncbi:MAG: hypothetical protein C0399_09460 [Syntrophus sp. (in: bacteria)]|nr:hypothetical protein [Syntrophus sp. (in: bacteria)]MBA4418405.1 hypothetical protein [Syntrophus sp. (in: bacteria)]
MATRRVIRQKSAEGIVGQLTEGPNVEVSGGLYALRKGDESDRRSHSPARHGNNPLNPSHAVGWDSISGYGPMTSTNRHVRTRMRGGVGRDG